ncbi:MAG TPA: LysR family transcriptional regulator, partial [Candidatus Methylomirabilis sp.]|nr:LysR family transcriptional regulator [Candidatus Methylomirabilis sp.]
ADAVWERYLRWATACWQGRVAEVLEELRSTLAGMTTPAESREEKPTDPYYVISKTIVYFEHNQPRMDYPRYRQQGLPVCSGLVESLIKQFNRRVKGTEKFWNEDQAETILQLRAAQLSEDGRLSEHLNKRTISPFRQYKTTKRRKAG